MRIEMKQLRKRIGRWSKTTSFLPLLVCRIALGWEFIISGWLKLHDRAGTTHYFSQLGIPAPGFNAVLVTGTELICGTLLLIGLFSRLATIPLTITMIVALLTAKHAEIHGLNGLFFQVEFAYICMFLVLFVFGPGAVSLDALVGRALERRHRTHPPRAHRPALAT
jgi:putative oxidoreductase